MKYINKLKKKQPLSQSIKFADFSKGMDSETNQDSLPITKGALVYNFDIKDGSLVSGVGFNELRLPISVLSPTVERTILMEDGLEIKRFWHYKYYNHELNAPKHQLLVYSADGTIYWIKLCNLDPYMYPLVQDKLYPQGTPIAINVNMNGSDFMIFSSSQDGMWKYQCDYPLDKIDDGPDLVSICMHYDKIFAIMEGQRNTIFYQPELDPTIWNDRTTVKIVLQDDDRGQLNKVLVLNDYVYVFRDFGVTKLSNYGADANLSVSHVYTSSDKIYEGSICLCGDNIIFMARDGIYEFNGNSAKKIDLKIDNMILSCDNSNCVAVYHDGKYYLACKMDYQDGEKVGCESSEEGYINNTLLELDLTDYSVNLIRGVDINYLLRVDDGNFCKIVASFNGEHCGKLAQLDHSGSIFGTPLTKLWKSPTNDMGYPNRQKRIKYIYIKTQNDCLVKISTEKQEKIFSIKGKNTTQKIKANIFGEQVSVSFVSSSLEENNISSPTIEFEVI